MHSIAIITLFYGIAIARPLRLGFGRRQETDVNRCRPLGENRCTLTVTDSLIDFPAPGKDNSGQGSIVEGSTVSIFDSGCFLKTSHTGVEPLGIGNGFGGPINVEGFSAPIDFFAQTIGGAEVTGIKFNFLGKEFTDCDCEDDSSGLTGRVACRCEFDCPPGPAAGFAPGFCGMHVTQFQKPDPSKDNYKLDIKLFDSVQTPIGATDGPQDAPANVPINLDSKLPFVMIVTAQNIDDDPIKFAYAGQNFDSNAGQCSVGRHNSQHLLPSSHTFRTMLYSKSTKNLSSKTKSQQQYFDKCIEEAQKSPMSFKLGAVLVKGGKILSSGFNHTRTGYTGPSSRGFIQPASFHAEMHAIFTATGGISPSFKTQERLREQNNTCPHHQHDNECSSGARRDGGRRMQREGTTCRSKETLPTVTTDSCSLDAPLLRNSVSYNRPLRPRNTRANGADLYVARILKDGTGAASPCIRCVEWCRWAGIRRIYHWDPSLGGFMVVKVNDRDAGYETVADARMYGGTFVP
ncbi:hypothetical protein DL96DRAFT_1821880 [Flagelloscypha sp. PMI_526]|nr:hypothetical protein DL96DRAFT_1821880 [Flagelloscypha sp. PMI_526]